MSVRCPSCGFESPAGASWCDFCKEPFAKKPPAGPPAGLTKEQLLELPAEQLLKADLPALPVAPSWLRPLAYTFLLVWVALGALTFAELYSRYLKIAH